MRDDRAPLLRPGALIPCYGDAATVGEVVRAVRRVLRPVIVVDDGGRDGAGAVARAAGAEVVRHAENRGKGAALLTGLAAACRLGLTHAVSVDADGQHDPADIPALLRAARARPRSLVLGARDFDAARAPLANRFARRASNFWVAVQTGHRLADTQTGLRVYPVAPTLGLGLPPSRFEWEIEVIVRALRAGLEVAEVKVGVRYPRRPRRRSHYRPVADTARIVRLHARLLPLPWRKGAPR